MKLFRCDKCGCIRKKTSIKGLVIYNIMNIELCGNCYNDFIDKLSQYFPDINIEKEGTH